MRRRRPMVSTLGDTRSKGRVSQAGNRSTASGPRKARRSAARRSASAGGRRGDDDRAPAGQRGEAGDDEGARPARARPGPRTSGRARTRSRARRASNGGRVTEHASGGAHATGGRLLGVGAGVEVVHGRVGPSVRIISTASAASDHADVELGPLGLARASSARGRRPGLAPGGLPMPMRTRRKSSVWRWALIDLSPLWPARPPPSLILIRPTGRSSSSWTTTRRWRSLDPVAPDQRRHRLARVVHEGLGERPGPGGWPPTRTSAASARSLPARAGRRGGGQQRDDLGADVVAGAGVLVAGVAEADGQQVGRGPAVGGVAAGRASALVAACGLAVAGRLAVAAVGGALLGFAGLGRGLGSPASPSASTASATPWRRRRPAPRGRPRS